MSIHRDQTSWSEAEKEYACKLWLEGKSASEVAEGVNASFGSERTRNSIIGLVNRRGLRRGKMMLPTVRKPLVIPNPRVKGARPVKARPKKPVVAKLPKNLGLDFNKVNSVEEQEQGREACRRVGVGIVEWVERGAGVESLNARPFFEGSGCKWPLAGGMRCCNSISRGQYCEGHAAVAYEKPQPKIDSKFMSRHDGVIDKYRPAQNTDRTLWDEARLAA